MVWLLVCVGFRFVKVDSNNVEEINGLWARNTETVRAMRESAE